MSSKSDGKSFGTNTNLVQLGRHSSHHNGSVNDPIYFTSTVLFDSYEEFLRGEKLYRSESTPHQEKKFIAYGRHGTLTTQSLSSFIAGLCHAEYSLISPSGVSALTTAILSVVKPGDHVLVSDGVYGPMRKVCSEYLPLSHKVECDFFDPCIKEADLKKMIRPNTKLIFCESPSSQTFEVQDIPMISKVAHSNGAYVLLDNTWATPLFFDAFAHGVDIIALSLTKYMSGHSDVLLGAVICKDPELIEKIASTNYYLGYSVSPYNCYQVSKGMRTLAARIKMEQESFQYIIKEIQKLPEVDFILHPTLPNSPGHEIYKRDFTGYVPLCSIVMKKSYSQESIAKMVDNLNLFGMGYSWGGFESLILPFEIDDKARTATDISNIKNKTCFRIHVGLEDPRDILKDLLDGIKRLAN